MPLGDIFNIFGWQASWRAHRSGVEARLNWRFSGRTPSTPLGSSNCLRYYWSRRARGLRRARGQCVIALPRLDEMMCSREPQALSLGSISWVLILGSLGDPVSHITTIRLFQNSISAPTFFILFLIPYAKNIHTCFNFR